MEMDKIMKCTFVLAAILAIALLSGCMREAPVTQPAAPEPERLNDKGQVICENHFCLYRHFQNCTPAFMSIPIKEGGNYEISIEGIIDGKCRNVRIINGERVECLYPPEEMNEQAFNHMFGTDSAEQKQRQTQLMNDYCRHV